MEVWNPGKLLPPLTAASLRETHRSVLRNPHLCEALFLARYIEKYGTGTLMMIRQSIEHALPEPDFLPRGGEFGVTLWRDWLTGAVLDRLEITERQRRAVVFAKRHGRITNKEYQGLAGAVERTSLRDLGDLVEKGILGKVGGVGRAAHYVLRRQPRQKPAKPATPSGGGATRQEPAKPAGAAARGRKKARRSEERSKPPRGERGGKEKPEMSRLPATKGPQ